ncbi:MAG: DUF429 domain-containing protein [Candidatus Calescibacterium sp.]|nr:DUF429 domain-containing protein [Candidatus Calescibacterium sp.]MCX7734122.1 DUF429 domain-containing protein [bacterium]MDW8088082.1 DUF429 domain-containing protein [Candidatus Calescibacterium sp.]
MIFVGLDLAGSPKRNTGLCFLDETKRALVKIVKTDQDILNEIKKISPTIVSVGIDAPLSLPYGRKNINSSGPHFRKCDLELRKLGIKFFPVTLGPMRKLTARGIKLKRNLLKIKPKILVAEVFPGALYDIFGIPRKSIKKILKFFKYQKIKIKGLHKNITQDEVDAVACAYTMYLFYKGKAKEIGDKNEGTIVIPTKRHQSKTR